MICRSSQAMYTNLSLRGSKSKVVVTHNQKPLEAVAAVINTPNKVPVLLCTMVRPSAEHPEQRLTPTDHPNIRLIRGEKEQQQQKQSIVRNCLPVLRPNPRPLLVLLSSSSCRTYRQANKSDNKKTSPQEHRHTSLISWFCVDVGQTDRTWVTPRWEYA